MKINYSLLTLFIFFTSILHSQSVRPDVIASAGDFFSNGSGQIQWTLGEVSVETYQNPGHMLTQGFHQPFTVATGMTNFSDETSASVFPNPTNGSVIIQALSLQGNYAVSLTDITGKLLQSDVLNFDAANSHTLYLDNYSDGMYFITISQNNTFIQSIRIVKNH